MPISYALFENNLTTDPSDFAAVVQIVDSLDLEEIADRMIAQGSTTTKADILAVLEDLIAAIEAVLQEGGRVNLGGLFEMYPRIRGVFNGAMDTFDPTRHTIDVGCKAGSRVRNTVQSKATVNKQEAIKPAPNPLQYLDTATGDSTIITTGNIGTLVGHPLKFDQAAADEGIFINTFTGPVQIPNTNIQKNKPGELVWLNPATLFLGAATIEVRARVDGGTELRTGLLDENLFIV